jgi:PIN domain nuclease of toxin-antitoxin system
MLNLDTHILLHALSGSLKPREKVLLSSSDWSISAIVLWEICKLVQLGRVSVDVEDAEVARTLRRIHTWPLTLEVCRESTRLDIRSDPADELIGATSVVNDVPLLTRDPKLLRSKRIPLAGRKAR